MGKLRNPMDDSEHIPREKMRRTKPRKNAKNIRSKMREHNRRVQRKSKGRGR